MAMVEQSKKDTMNAADFAEEFKTTPGRTPRIPETPERLRSGWGGRGDGAFRRRDYFGD